MKKIALLVVAFVLLVANITLAEVVLIKGYSAKEYAIKGQVEQELAAFTEIVKGLQVSNEQLQFKVIGFADVSGTQAENDEWGKKRAEAVREYLSATFSGSKVNAWSKGDSGNVREVHIEYVVLNPVGTSPSSKNAETQKPQETKDSFFNLLPYLVAGIALGLLLFFVLRPAKNKKATSETANNSDEVKEVKKEIALAKIRTVEAKTRDEEAVVIVVIEHDDHVNTPVKTDGQTLTCPSYQIAKKKVREYCKKFTKAELLNQGVLKADETK